MTTQKSLNIPDGNDYYYIYYYYDDDNTTPFGSEASLPSVQTVCFWVERINQ